MRTVIIGDIHGCYKEFLALLSKLKFDEKLDVLILNGDLIDRGPDSYEVVQFVMELQGRMKERLVFVRGSHEYLLLTSEKKLQNRLLWNLVGRKSSEKSFANHNEELMGIKQWIIKSSVLYYKSQLFQCAHAGVRVEPIEENDEYTLLMNHGLVKKNMYRGRLTITGHIHLKKPTYFDGHGNVTVLEYGVWSKLPKTGVICIDTGCSESGILTGMVVSDDMFFIEKYEI